MSRLVPIIGHLLQQEQLQNDIDLGNVSHAYLFSGPAHIGKHALALRFACDLLSVDVSDDQKASVRHSV
ncbi:MAG: hypothetical protein KC680_00200, partial [Candidatus Peregrinibacteria bacterium]|nr:hypothetical protein [Candidatus Peregrinibacteria bacterium]